MELAMAQAVHGGGEERWDGFDAHGFWLEPQRWTPELAGRIARLEGIGMLDAGHWQLIDHVRRHYFALGALPVMRLVCRRAGVERAHAQALFGSCRRLWRIAGLPDPGEEARAYMH